MKWKALILPAIVAVLLLDGAPASAQTCSGTCPAQTIGTIEAPADGSTVAGYVQVKGFALDGNLVSNVDLFVDGTDEINRVTPPGGANINLPRADVLQAFPAYAGTAGDHPGFEMSFKAANYANGAHTLYIRITDVTGCCYFLAPRAVTVDNSRNQAPFGTINFPTPDQPVAANGVLSVTGWALDDRKVDHIEIAIDGLLERDGVMGIYRPDVAAYYPDNADALTSGYLLFLDSTRWYNGVHQLTVWAVDDQGQKGFLGTRQIQVFNNAPNLAPFGDIDYPLLNPTWFGNCFNPIGGPSGGEVVDQRYVQHIFGWALDAGQVVDRGGVSHVQVELDGVLLRDSRIDCRREFLLGQQLVDCYGYYRPDIEILYPGFTQAPNCGFHFVIDVGVLLTQKGIKEGAHLLQIKAIDKEDQKTSIKDIPVVLECADQNLDPPPIGFVDDPSNYKLISGVYPVIGWALDLDFVVAVRVLIDGVPQIDAIRGVDYAEYGLASPDVAALYAAFPQSSRARWRFYLDTTKISNSEHDLLVEVLDGRGNKRSAGTRRFLVNNNTLVR